MMAAPVFFIMMIACILMLVREIKDKYMFFMIIGGLTSFFDFLTVPILTLGMPLLIYALIKNKKKCDVKKLLIELFKYCVMWGIGYFGIWLAKWILVDVICKKEIIKTSLEQYIYRSKVENVKLESFLWVIWYVINTLSISFIIVCGLTIFKVLKYKDLKNVKFNFKEILVYFCISLLVILWILIVKQHFIQHRFFTYRNILLTVICMFLMIYNLFIPTESSEDNKKNK